MNLIEEIHNIRWSRSAVLATVAVLRKRLCKYEEELDALQNRCMIVHERVDKEKEQIVREISTGSLNVGEGLTLLDRNRLEDLIESNESTDRCVVDPASISYEGISVLFNTTEEWFFEHVGIIPMFRPYSAWSLRWETKTTCPISLKIHFTKACFGRGTLFGCKDERMYFLTSFEFCNPVDAAFDNGMNFSCFALECADFSIEDDGWVCQLELYGYASK